jgi:ATP-dependent helicase/nuclease subunit A
VLVQPPHTREAHAGWFDAASPAADARSLEVTELDVELDHDLRSRAVAASRPRARPTAFSDASDPRRWWGKNGRFGTAFGETVHIAIGLALRHERSAGAAVASAAARTGLSAHLSQAADDVRRALAALASLGIAAGQRSFSLEYPIAGLSPNGDLVAGYIDLIATLPEGTVVLDFKTDMPPADVSVILPMYVEQARGYAAALQRALQIGAVRAGLLFTADGVVRWLPSDDHS